MVHGVGPDFAFVSGYEAEDSLEDDHLEIVDDVIGGESASVGTGEARDIFAGGVEAEVVDDWQWIDQGGKPRNIPINDVFPSGWTGFAAVSEPMVVVT